MTILHIAVLYKGSLGGVDIVVPQHVQNQQLFATVGLLNMVDYKVENLRNSFSGGVDFSKLPDPFNQPDLVVVHGIYDFGLNALKLKKLLLKRKIPFVIVCHGELTKLAQSKRKLKKTISNTVFFSSFFNNATAIQCLSENEYKNTLVKAPKILCTNGVVLPKKQKEYKERKKLKVVYIGRLEVYIKGLDLLIEAVKQISLFLRAHNCCINIYGPDIKGRYDQVQQLIHNNEVTDIVTLHHEVIGEEKENILLDSDLFIQTSRTEGLPLGILEAFSYGIPVIATEGTNMTVDINNWDAGWGVETSSSAIANALEKAINEKEKWSEKGNNARQIIINKYIWEKVAKNTIDEYKGIIEN